MGAFRNTACIRLAFSKSTKWIQQQRQRTGKSKINQALPCLMYTSAIPNSLTEYKISGSCHILNLKCLWYA